MNGAARALLARAAVPHAADTVLFARLIGARVEGGDLSLLGLTDDALSALIERHFPGAAVPFAGRRLVLHNTFRRDLRALLLWHDRTDCRDDVRCLASIIAEASLRPDHLWRDLGLSGRDDVTAMLDRHYPALIARNVANLRWKKFLAQEVARAHAVASASVVACAPGCPGCEDFTFCYPEGTARVPV